ncbi:menaquinol oxidoreductase complex Cbc5, cytochrome c subunit, putative [Citrifermentans bemidjiense Bem]|uniref:Menaquinol oxidoreductase complex Cbc5, cytochrome c subunit, putative n=1 Tax=Citrifermentans bemidjiense (strain ATCC BAA-1014 / DSM 16622 / JCM 12645 / Bem) TaxID=404380 RepID=B5EDB7_CITBB|nr:multiheme c-type cytochrome [Citrifermentans bemidjiense]ACH37703.1 menaquinol oxidoreductase complex Cbc5, cytochrome c subunit, putative [Citrifermentans bemidjiense Bem]
MRYRETAFFLTLSIAAWVCLSVLAQPGASAFSYGEEAGKNESCLACHGDSAQVPKGFFIDTKHFNQTTHARIGCEACHAAVPATHPDGAKVARAGCGECHADVDREYATGLHVKKTTCNGCHNPHMVHSPKEISGQEINAMCSNCHNTLEMTARHGEWLPQSELHLRMLPCITCHTGSKEYFISMYIVKSKNGSMFGKQEVAGYDELKQMSGGKEIVSLIDKNRDNYVSLEELRVFNRSQNSLRLHGMMTPVSVSHKFEILDDRRNCTFCHTSGPALMQTSFIAVPEADGSYSRVPVEKGAVLDALYGTPDFYMMGSTKNGALNKIGLAIICGGLIMPVGHGFVRFLTRKNRNTKEHKS